MALITEAQIRGLVLVAEGTLEPDQFALWNTIRIEPEVRFDEDAQIHGIGFWVIARDGVNIIWYDSLAEQFCAGTADEPNTIPTDIVQAARSLDGLFSSLDLDA